MSSKKKSPKVASKVDTAHRMIQDAVAKAFEGLSEDENYELTEKLLSDAEGWRMELSERTPDDPE